MIRHHPPSPDRYKEIALNRIASALECQVIWLKQIHEDITELNRKFPKITQNDNENSNRNNFS